MYIKFSRCSQAMIGFFIFCWLWTFGIAQQDTTITLANSELEVGDTNRLLMGVSPNTTATEVEKVLQDANLGDLVVEKFWSEFGIALVKIPERSASPIVAANADAMQRLEAYRQSIEQIPIVDYVIYNTLISIAVPTDAIIERPLSHINESASYAPSDGTTGQEVVVALVDSGFSANESDLNDNLLWENQVEVAGVPGVDDDQNGFIDDYHGWDWIDNDNRANDVLGHGTDVGKMILDLDEQINGDNNVIKLMPLRILREDGKGEISDLVAALAYALRKDVPIANLSLISYYNSPPLAAAIRIAHAEGLLMVASSGNFGARTYWPAVYPETLSVRGVSQDDDFNTCHVSSEVDVAILVESDEYTSMNGTPDVTAAIALALDQYPELSVEEIRAAVRDASSCTNGAPDGIRPLEIEEFVAILQSPTALSETTDPLAHQLYLPLITK